MVAALLGRASHHARGGFPGGVVIFGNAMLAAAMKVRMTLAFYL